MKSYSFINNLLSEIQIKELSNTVLYMYGNDLSLDELTESIYLLMENIPGIDLISTQKLQSINSQIRNQYHEEIRKQKNKTFTKEH